MIDSHCHLDLPIFEADRAAVLVRAAAVGVRGVLIPAIRPATFGPLGRLAKTDGAVPLAVAIGVHPQIVPALTAVERAVALDPDALAAAAVHQGAVAIGECGLDGATADPALQEAVLRVHVRAARALGLPLVVHVLRAHDLAPRVLREEGASQVGGVLHSYSGGPELVPVYRALGFVFSFAGPVTYPGARRPLEAVRAVPAEALLVETDAPDQTPVPHRGQRSEPAFLPEIVAGLARARGVTSAEIAALTAANTRRVFSRWLLPPPAGEAAP